MQNMEDKMIDTWHAVAEAARYVVTNCKDDRKWSSGQLFLKGHWNVIVAK